MSPSSHLQANEKRPHIKQSQSKLKAERIGASEGLYYFARTVIAKYHRLGGFNNRNLFSNSSGIWASKIKVPAGLVSLLADGCPSTPHSHPSVHVHPWGLLACPHFLFLEAHQPYWIRTHPDGLILLNCLFKGTISK